MIVPWELYRAYGDTAVLPSCGRRWSAWLDRAERMARSGGTPPARRAARSRRRTSSTSGTPASTGASGWSRARTVGDFGAFVAADKGDVATAYFAHSAGLMARIAAVLGRDDDAARYAELAERVRAAWQAEYLDADGRLTPDTQANHVRALAFDLVPDELRPAVADRLVELIREAGHPSRHRLPGHAVPAAGAGRHRPPRRRLRAAARRTPSRPG